MYLVAYRFGYRLSLYEIRAKSGVEKGINVYSLICTEVVYGPGEVGFFQNKQTNKNFLERVIGKISNDTTYLIVIILAVFGHFKEIFIIVEKSLSGSWSLLKNLVYALRTIVVLHFGSLFVPDSITVSL